MKNVNNSEFVQYVHWNETPGVWVRKELKGKHRQHCLCHSCKKLNMEDRNNNCPTANLIYSICVRLNMTLPVWECQNFEEKGEQDA